MTVRISIAVANQALRNGRRIYDIPGFLAECAAADHSGFDFAYTGEKHVGDTSYSPSPFVMATLALSNTVRLRFGISLVVLPLHNPVHVAEQAAVIDAAFPGRFRLGVGLGSAPDDFAVFGVPYRERASRLQTGLEAIDSFRSRHPMPPGAGWPASSVPARDPALGDDRLEVFLGAWSEAGVRRAARMADGWITGPVRTVAALEHLAAVYRSECERVGKRPRIVMLREAWLEDTDEEARAVIGPHVLAYHRIYLEGHHVYDSRWDPWIDEISSPLDLTLDDILTDRLLIGSPGTWVDLIDDWSSRLGAEEIILRLRHLQGPPLEDTLAVIDRIGCEIIPKYNT